MTHRGAEQAEWSLAGESGVGLLRARYVRQSFPRHSHDYFVVCVDERGAHASWYRGANVVIPERAITVVPPGAVHSGAMVPGRPWHYRAMYPSLELITALASELALPAGCTPSFRDLSVNDPELAALFLHAHVRAERSDDELERESLVLSVLLAVIQRHATEARRVNHDAGKSPGVTRAVELMRSCYGRRLTLADLAQAAGTGRYAIIRAFQRQIGMSPYAFLTQIRVQCAMQLLQAGASVAVTAQRVGCTDQSHLTRKFKRFVGITPAAFARGARR